MTTPDFTKRPDTPAAQPAPPVRPTPTAGAYPPPAPTGVPQAGWGAPPTATPARTMPPALALLAAVGIAVVGAVVWALLLRYADITLSVIAIATGSIIGALLSSALGRGPVAAAIAAVLTVVSSLVGEVVGVWYRIAHDLGISVARVRSGLPVGTLLSHLHGLTWIFIVAGAVFAVLAGLGRRNMYNGGGLRRRRRF